MKRELVLYSQKFMNRLNDSEKMHLKIILIVTCFAFLVSFNEKQSLNSDKVLVEIFN
jgi:hypothetical protein